VLTAFSSKIKPRASWSPFLQLEQLVLLCKKSISYTVPLTLKCHWLQHLCVQYKECGKINLWLYALIIIQHDCLETDVKAFNRVTMFTAPQILVSLLVWLKRKKTVYKLNQFQEELTIKLNQIQRIYEYNEFTSLVCLPGYTTSPSMGSISLS
jgi:hypothetical protein